MTITMRFNSSSSTQLGHLWLLFKTQMAFKRVVSVFSYKQLGFILTGSKYTRIAAVRQWSFRGNHSLYLSQLLCAQAQTIDAVHHLAHTQSIDLKG